MTTQQIEVLLNATTQGAWIASKETGVLPNGVVQSPNGYVIALSCASEADATFIAAAPAIVRQLLDEIERRKANVVDFPELMLLYNAMKESPDDIQKRCDYFEALADARLNDCYIIRDQLADLKRKAGS